MAIVVPMRKKYKPRNIVEAVVDNVLRLRSNCNTMTNPNTPAQQYVRSRFKLMHGLQQGLTPLLQRGFNRQLNARARWVGAYHVALGHNMREAARYNSETKLWECDFSRFALCEHRSRAPKRITVQRRGHLLLLSYRWKGHAERTSILWAVYNRTQNQWVQGLYDTRFDGNMLACAIPPEWKDAPLEVLIGFGRDAEGRGQLRGTHHFTLVTREAIVTVRGGIRGAQHAVNEQDIDTSPYAVVVVGGVQQGTFFGVEIRDKQGVTLRIQIACWLE